jgi:hypothetical protein
MKTSRDLVVNEVVLDNSEVDIEHYVEQYHLCLTKSAEAILNLAILVYTANKNLGSDKFKVFRERIGAGPTKDSYIQKLICIASESSRFTPVIDILPPNYTTLYSLSQLSDKRFSELCAKNVISPTMTANTLANGKCLKKLYKKPKLTDSNNSLIFTVDLREIDARAVKRVLKALYAVCDEFDIEYECEIDPIHRYRDELQTV